MVPINPCLYIADSCSTSNLFLICKVISMAKTFIFFILAVLLLSTAQTRLLSAAVGKHADDDSQMPISSPESSLNEDECKGLDGEECLIRRSLAAHADYIYTQETASP